MNLFSEIEGLRGENLSSALIRVLLMRSQDARTRFAERLSDLYSQSFSSLHRFACGLEEWTADDSHGGGRIDLVIEMDNALVGIENKFNANFQDGQPQKYLTHLIERTKQLADQQSSAAHKTALLVLAPASRRHEVERKLAELPTEQRKLCRFFAWEEFLADLNSIRDTQDSKSQEIINDFSTYVNNYLRQSFFHQNETWKGSLHNWVEYGSERQRRVVAELWSLFPGSGSRLSVGAVWVGYYFGNKGWFGFVDRERTIQSAFTPAKFSRESEFVIVTGFPVSGDLDANVFHPTHMQHKGFCGQQERGAWIVDLSQLNTESKWHAALAPIAVATRSTAL